MDISTLKTLAREYFEASEALPTDERPAITSPRLWRLREAHVALRDALNEVPTRLGKRPVVTYKGSGYTVNDETGALLVLDHLGEA